MRTISIYSLNEAFPHTESGFKIVQLCHGGLKHTLDSEFDGSGDTSDEYSTQGIYGKGEKNRAFGQGLVSYP